MKLKILLFLSMLAVFSCKKETKEDKVDLTVLSVSTAKVGEISLKDAISASGMLSSKSEIKLAFKTGGVIRKSYAEEGDFVKSGQLLAELDMSEIDAQVNQAKIGFEKAKRDLQRVENLYKDEAATETYMNDAKSGLDIATQTLKAAEFNKKLSKIYAPSSGHILKKLAEQGELIGPFAPMFILGQGQQAYIVKVGLTDRDMVKVALGDHAEVTLDAYPNEKFGGKLTQIDQTFNPATGTYDVEVELFPTQKRLISGFVAKVILQPKASNKSLAVPVEALVNAEAKRADVYILQGEKVHKRDIEIGKIIGDYVSVTSGLVSGEEVVTKGSGYVSDGEQVKVNNRIP